MKYLIRKKFLDTMGCILILILLAGCARFPQGDSVPLVDNVEPQTVATEGYRIHDIQGDGLRSPLEGERVENIPGIVTAFRADGFYLQDPEPDQFSETSEAIFVFTGIVPSVRPGDHVRISGIVKEFYPGGIETNNQPVTHITEPTITNENDRNSKVTPVKIGKDDRVPPSRIIDDDAGKQFEPLTDGLDFYESLESMLVQIDSARVVAASNEYKEITIVPDDLTQAGIFSHRGSIILRVDDQNPERILLDDSLRPLPLAAVRDKLAFPIIGIMDYSFGNFKLQPVMSVKFVAGGLEPEAARTPDENELVIGTYNLENLDPKDPSAKFLKIATEIVDSLNSPDLLVLQEVQDNNGILDDGTVDANLTYALLIDAIVKIGGPKYEFRDIPPGNNRNGGEPGGNIRVGFIFRTDRGLAFIDRKGMGNTDNVDFVLASDRVQLSRSPGLIQPEAIAFNDSRKPLVGEFSFKGESIFVIGLHLVSKGDDDALYGLVQPPKTPSTNERISQAAIIHRFIANLLSLDPNANIIVAGDFNDFQFSPVITTLKGELLLNSIDLLPIEEQFTYIHEGNAQVLDHILMNKTKQKMLSEIDIVHINAEFPDVHRSSDHDPLLVFLRFGF